LSNHLQEEDLILYHYGEGEREPAMDDHLKQCPSCRQQLQQLGLVLSEMDKVEVPARDAAYEKRLWRQIQPRLQRRRFSLAALFKPTTWGPILAFSALLALAFLAGRYTGPHTPDSHTSTAKNTGERVLLASVSDHLDRTRMFLTDLTHRQNQKQPTYLARNLVEDNRLYMKAAELSGENELAAFLEEMELTLLDLAHRGKGQLSIKVERSEREDHKEIIFKIDVFGTDLRERQKKTDDGAKTQNRMI